MSRVQGKRAAAASAQQQLSHNTTGFAVPVLAQPFPAPRVMTVTCSKPATGKFGIRFRWNGGQGDRVHISKIAEHSPLLETVLRPGHIVLAINGVAALTSTQTVGLIQNSGPSVTITACSESSVLAPFCKLVTAPSWKHHPGVIFNSCRERCLVQVSRVFSKGPFAGSDLNSGDIALAVNGVPISKPEDADRELREAQLQPYTILYVVKMIAYRDSVVSEIRASPIFHNVRLIQNEGSLIHRKEVLFAAGEEIYARLEFDFESQHLVDREAHLRLGSFAKGGDFFDATKCFGRQYRTIVLPFLHTYNEGMERRMRVLEEAVCCAAWKHAAESRIEAASERSSPQDEWRTVESPTSVSSEEDDESSLAATTVPVAAVEIEVLPVEALQTLCERGSSSNRSVRAI